jgi:hypothetical protein
MRNNNQATETTMKAQDVFATLPADQLTRASGGAASCDLSGLPASARSIIMAESGGDPTAKNPHSTAFGLGQLIVANRKALMGANYASTDCGAQLEAFTKYTKGRYGSFDKALSFRKSHGWY